MSKPKPKTKTPRRPKVGDNDPRLWGCNQRAHTFVDRKKKANKDACRKGQWD
jgi:hypothetical protein